MLGGGLSALGPQPDSVSTACATARARDAACSRDVAGSQIARSHVQASTFARRQTLARVFEGESSDDDSSALARTTHVKQRAEFAHASLNMHW